MDARRTIYITTPVARFPSVQANEGSQRRFRMRIILSADNDTRQVVEDFFGNPDVMEFVHSLSNDHNVEGTESVNSEINYDFLNDYNFQSIDENVVGCVGSILNSYGSGDAVHSVGSSIGSIPNADAVGYGDAVPNAEGSIGMGWKILYGLAAIAGCATVMYGGYKVAESAGEASKAIVQAVNGWKEAGFPVQIKIEKLTIF